MNKKLKQIYKNNKLIVWAAAVSVILSIAVLIIVKDEVTRFTLIMPIFAGFILFSILVTPDEELEDGFDDDLEMKEKPVKSKKPARKTR